jgi:hypothetical protein
MATNFPSDLDVLINPESTDSVKTVSHSKQHADANDAIEALEVKVGKNNDTNVNSLDYKVRTLETNALDPEEVEDLVGDLLVSGSHTNITVFYDDAARKINLTGTYTDERAITAIANSIVATGGINKVYDSAAKTITLSVNTNTIASQSYVNTAIANLIDSSPALLDTLKEIAAAINNDANFSTTITSAISTALASSKAYTDAAISALGNTSDNKYVPVSEVGQADGIATLDQNGKVPLSQLDLDEKIQDVAASLITSGTHTNLTATYDDATGKINFTAVAQLTQEQVQDFIAPLFTHGSNPNISATYDDVANKMILEAYIPPSTAKMSANAPSSPIDGQFWFDTDEVRSGSIGSLKVWNALNSAWENVTTNLSQSTTNTWTSKNTFNNGIIIGLAAAPLTPAHGQIYYNTILDKLKVWDGLLWQDIQGSGGGGGLTLVPTDTSVPASTFFVGLIAPPSGATIEGDLWIDVDDDAGSTEFVFAGPNPPAEGTYGMDTLWIDTDDPDLPLIYSDNEPPSYSAIEGDFWVDLDDTSGQSILSSTTAPNPAQTEFWLDLTTEEGEITYSDLFKYNAAQIINYASLPPASNFAGMIAYVSSESSLYVAANGEWVKIFPNYDAEALLWSGI